jgi:hypothetical protein
MPGHIKCNECHIQFVIKINTTIKDLLKNISNTFLPITIPDTLHQEGSILIKLEMAVGFYYKISMASPYVPNRYFSFIANLYALNRGSNPVNDETIISIVERGR